MSELRLSRRLRCAAELCREGSFVADVGTDHAYLPIALLGEGRIRGGVVSDINKGPLERAKKHIEEYGAQGKLVPILCDGLAALDAYAPEDIFILGMGGELIARIIADAPWTKNENVRLILQPMTHPELLRAYLAEAGYGIVDERLVKEDKIYQIIAAEYSGERQTYNDIELLFGKINIERGDPLFLKLAEHWERVLRDRIEGKRRALADTSYEEKILEMIGDIK